MAISILTRSRVDSMVTIVIHNQNNAQTSNEAIEPPQLFNPF